MGDPIDEFNARLSGAIHLHEGLGDGAQGSVFRGEDANGSPLALKLYSGSVADVARIQREFDLLRRNASPNLARALDMGQVELNGVLTHWVSWELVVGPTLAEQLCSLGPLPRDLIVQLAEDLVGAVGSLWSSRVVHRDVKPPNIIFSESERRYKLVDLGIARFTALDSISLTGHAFGTSGYMSPEQLSGEKALTVLSDIYAVGVVLSEVLGRTHPTGRNQYLLLRGPIVLPTSDPLSLLCARMTDPDPLKRPSIVESAALIRDAK